MTAEPGPPHDRAAELAANLAAVRSRVAAACAGAGRDPAEVTLVAVTKTFGVDDVRRLVDLGVTDLGENRDQEAAAKAASLAAALAAVAERADLRLRGVMAVAPMDADPDAAFAGLVRVAAAVRAAAPEATVVSAGMSGDLEAAIRHGATHVRVGTALLGGRPRLVG